MRKLDTIDWCCLIYSILAVLFMATLLINCQPTNPLKGLNCPCDVISVELTYNGYEATYIDKDGELQTVISEALYIKYHNNLKQITND